MNTNVILALMQDTLKTAAMLAAPMLLAAMATGLLMSILQTVTSIQEQSLTIVPKMAATVCTAILVLPWGIETLLAFTTRLYQLAATFGH